MYILQYILQNKGFFKGLGRDVWVHKEPLTSTEAFVSQSFFQSRFYKLLQKFKK